MLRALPVLALFVVSTVNCQASRDKIISMVIQNAIRCKNQPAATGCFLDQKTLICMGDSFATSVCNTKTIAEASKDLMAIAMKCVPLGPKAQVVGAYSNIDKCLKGCSSSVDAVLTKVINVVSGTFGSVYTSVKAVMTKVVASGQKCGSAPVLAATYDEFVKYATQAYIKKLYDLLIQNASCGEVQCAATNAKTMIFTDIAVSRMNSEKKCTIK